MTALIEITDLHYRPESLADEASDILQEINLQINDGEFVAIIGENGSGKSTLLKHINALLMPTQGTVEVYGLDTRDMSTYQKLRMLVGMVFQDPTDQIVSSTVAEDIAFGLENMNLPTSEIQARVTQELQTADLTEEAFRPPHLLSGGQIQKLALAGVLARHPRIILFDEPTSMLDPVTRQKMLKQIRKLHDEGKTILYVTQHMEETVYADRIVVLFEGKIALDGRPADIFSNYLKLYEIGLDVPEAVWIASEFRKIGWDLPENILSPVALLTTLPLYHNKNVQPNNENNPISKETILELEDVQYTYLSKTPLSKKALQGVNLTVEGNRVHGIIGTNGSGKSTLLQHINGILRPEKGRVRVKTLEVSSQETALRDVIQVVGLVFQNPETQFFEVFVGDEVAYGPKQFKMEELRNRVRESMELVGLDFEKYKDRRLETLSGGEKRKVALASTLVLDQEILLFDEPTAGMDPRSRDDLLKLIGQLQNHGKTILIASHRLDELASVAQQLSLMKNGRITHTGNTCQVLQDKERINEVGLTPPLAIMISQALIKRGWPIEGFDTATPKRLLAAVKRVQR